MLTSLVPDPGSDFLPFYGFGSSEKWNLLYLVYCFNHFRGLWKTMLVPGGSMGSERLASRDLVIWERYLHPSFYSAVHNFI